MSLTRARAGGDRGQASLEWLAVVALVATLLGLGAALAQASFIGRRVTREMARAICLVGDGDCRRDQEPCVVGSDSDRRSWSASVAIVKVGSDRLALIEQRSDGTYAVTIEKARKGGLSSTIGKRVEVHLGGVDISVGGDVTAALLARLGGGRTWIVGSAAEARALVAQGGGGRAPDVVYDDGTWLGSAGATLGLDGSAAGSLTVADAGVTFDQRWGTSTDRRTGHHTIYFDASWAAEGKALGGVLGVARAGDAELYAVETDGAGRPLDLRVTAVGTYAGSRDLPSAVQPVAGLLAAAAPAAGTRRFEVTAHLDLTDPRNLAAARGLLAAMGRKEGRAAPAQELRRRIDQQGTIEARVLDEEVVAEGDHALSLSEGAATAGFETQGERRVRRLLAATSRGLDGQWLTRTDCVAP
jgi:hypothetical protein